MIKTSQVKELNSGSKVITHGFKINNKTIKLHTYVAPEKYFGNATHIIETLNFLSLVDTQYITTYSKEFREYANSLNKPIAGVIISHSHPDHYFGLNAFSDVHSYAFEETIRDIEEKGEIMIEESKKDLGDLIPNQVIVPTNILYEGDVVIDGLLFRYKKYNRAEADTQVVIELPELNTVIVQDLVYNGYHAWIGKNIGKNVNNWLKTINNLKLLYKQDTLVLVGHGEPTTPAVYDRMIRYLNGVDSIIKQSFDGNKLNLKLVEKRLLQVYGHYKGKHIIPMWLRYY